MVCDRSQSFDLNFVRCYNEQTITGVYLQKNRDQKERVIGERDILRIHNCIVLKTEGEASGVLGSARNS